MSVLYSDSQFLPSNTHPPSHSDTHAPRSRRLRVRIWPISIFLYSRVGKCCFLLVFGFFGNIPMHIFAIVELSCPPVTGPWVQFGWSMHCSSLPTPALARTELRVAMWTFLMFLLKQEVKNCGHICLQLYMASTLPLAEACRPLTYACRTVDISV